MSTVLWMVGLAWGAEIDRYPWQAEVSCGACSGEGVYAFEVPVALRSAEDPPDGSDLTVVDARGQEVPVAWVLGGGAVTSTPLSARPLPEPYSYVLGATDLAVDEIEVRLPGDGCLAEVRVERLEGEVAVPWGAPQRVWREGSSVQERVRVPPSTGPWKITLHPYRWGRRDRVSFSGVSEAFPGLGPQHLTLPVSDPILDEDGGAAYIVRLPHPLPLRAISLRVDEPLFERTVTVRPLRDDSGRGWETAQGSVRRVQMGGASLDEVRVALGSITPSRALQLEIPTRGKLPLTLTGVELEVQGRIGVVRGEPPFTLYGGAPAGTTPPSDLGVAVTELAAAVTAVLPVGAVGPSPVYVPPEVRGGLIAPSVPLDTEPSWRAPVIGGPGLVAVALDADRFSRSEGGHAELRLSDAEGRQIPAVLYQRAEGEVREGLPFTRDEERSTSRLVVKNPWPGRALQGLTLHSPAPTFDRQLTVSRVDGARLMPLRVIRWQAADRPRTLSVRLDDVVGEELVIEIENGNNPPLPLDAVGLSVKTWELRAWLPEGEVFLSGGDPRADAPDYDLSLVQSELLLREAAPATLGPFEELGAPPRSLLDRAVLGGGLAAFALGLLGMVVGLLRRIPEAPPEAPAPDEQPGEASLPEEGDATPRSPAGD
ncbi:MAG: hypothetical protein JXX28_02365 [Deltaproteobacteria bacterium]|nr:hypothetical protein [Deltaproteobacteria bacterium]